MNAPRCLVVGAGLAGLAAALDLARQGLAVEIHESGPRAGGRCRSYFDRELDCRLDNGNHLLLSANDNALSYLNDIGTGDSLSGPSEPVFPFHDLATGERWSLRPNRLSWIFDSTRRVPGAGPGDHLATLRLAWAGNEASVAGELARRGTIYRRLWEPLTVAILNTEAEAASAALLWRVLKLTLGRGPDACRPLVVRQGLSESFVTPALAKLTSRRAEIRFGSRLRRLDLADGLVRMAELGEETRALAPADRIILAVPAPVAADLLPNLIVPTEFRAILNAHYRLAPPPDAPAILGLVGGLAQWVFAKNGVVSVTVSAADAVIERDAGDLASTLWAEVARAYGIDASKTPPSRIVKEKRATFAATPAQLRRRPGPVTAWSNLYLAGDWTDTGLPATIEGAIQSGKRAAAALLADL
jgi:squalene-associated FAD-dependent desaturase